MSATNALEVPAFWGWFDHFVASVKLAAIRAGLELSIWEKIAQGYCTAEAIAAREGWEADGVRRLLNVLVSIGLLTGEADCYRLVAEADWYLVPGNPPIWGDFCCT
ncbi:MAG: hypothetical protein H3C34_15885 [Caldilineaceae bacterium]|nr:hypothetical protein [Caldilineaceae bacterium]